MTIALALGVVFTLLNLQLGKSMVKRYGKWQFGLLNWGVALFLGCTSVELALKMFNI